MSNTSFCSEIGIFISKGAKNEYADLLHKSGKLKNVHIIAEKTGSGKTNTMQLISIGAAERASLHEDAEYLLVYHDKDNRFALESSGIAIRNVPDSDKTFEYNIPRGYRFTVDEHGCAEQFRGLNDNTVIFNGFDKYSLSNTVYTDNRIERFSHSDHSLHRIRAAYQNTDLFFVCKYLDRYIRSFSQNSIQSIDSPL